MARKEKHMEPIRIRVTRIIDFGTIISIVGVDLESNAPVNQL
jgi:hypothetical protein